MKLSVSTKIFLGFAVVIFAFGSASAYSIYRMNAHRESVAIIWQEVNPISLELRSMLRRLQAQDEFLELKKARDAEYLQRALPTLKPFEQFRAIEAKLLRLISSGVLSDSDHQSLLKVKADIEAFRTGQDLYNSIQGRELESLGLKSSGSSEELYHSLIDQAVTLANEGKLHHSTPQALAIRRTLRRINHVVIDLRHLLDEQVRTLDQRAADDEKVATLAVILIATAALLISLLMLFISQWTLAPIRRLSEGVRRVAAGHYDEKVEVRTSDEIGQLAQEFNRMASALQERDTKLEQQRTELLRADRLATIGKLAAQITHEVRNPLSSIGLNAELIEEELDLDSKRDEVKQMVRSIQREVERLKDITERYLQYARLPQPDLAPVPLAQLIRELMTFLSSELAEAGVDWNADELEEGVLALADAAQIRQALMNLARNAVEAVAGRAPTQRRIWVRLRSIGEDVVAIDVTDSGEGIDPELLDRIFEPFVTGKPHGTGLGLALTHEIVTEHKGRIVVESPVFEDSEGGFGATFRIELPRQKMEDAIVDGA